MPMTQHIISVSDLKPGDTYSEELGGYRRTVEEITPRGDDPFGRPYVEIKHEGGEYRFRVSTDQLWRDN